MSRHDLNELRRDYGPNGRPMRATPAVKLALEELGEGIEQRRAVLQQEAAAYDNILEPAPWVDVVLVGTGVLFAVGVLSMALYCVLEWLGRAR